jgi:UDP-N-acetylglucosamine 2-epimerase (non-hydrolysing)
MSARIALVLGIRPDIIRAARIIRILDEDPRCELLFIWSGQHYSDNLKDIFFRELGVRRPDVELGCAGETDAETSSQIISRLFQLLQKDPVDAVVFLGDTNTVVGSLAAAQCNIPILHIEGCMRSFDWRMPEEKYRTMIDHLSDVIYAYLPAYRDNGLLEGLSPDRIVVTGNPIVDIIHEHYPPIRASHEAGVLLRHSVVRQGFALMTAHRRENVEDPAPLGRIMELASAAPCPVLFAASYRTQKNLQRFGTAVPENVRVLDPLGYTEFLSLLGACRYTLTDSGTVVEEACVLGMPSIQMRRSTERPEVYDVGASIRFDPGDDTFSQERARDVIAGAERLVNTVWQQPFGDGTASARIAEDILSRAADGRFPTHAPDLSQPRVRRAAYGNSI